MGDKMSEPVFMFFSFLLNLWLNSFGNIFSEQSFDS